MTRPSTLADYLAILRRRKWIIIALPVMAAAVAYAVSQTQSPLYKGTAEILVNRSSVVSAITNVSDPAIGDPRRFLTTQASIARSPELAERVVAAAGVRGLSPDQLLSSSSVHPQPDADLLDVSVTWPNRADAARITNVYAREFTRYKTELDTQKINDALRSLRTRIAALQSRNAASSPGYETLVQYQSQLETIGTLLANNTTVLQPADSAEQVRPRPRRSILLGALLGGVIGLGLAFFAEALDRRVRSEDEIEGTLGLPLIGRVPRPPRSLRKSNRLVMLAEPTGVHAEMFRKLKTTLEFVNLERGARTIMVTSAVPGEGKSTTVANLAVAFARAGRRVALVDLDLRRPFLHSFFHAPINPGIVDVIVKQDRLSSALRPVALPARLAFDPASSTNGASAHGLDGSERRQNGASELVLLPSGAVPLAAAEFLESDRLGVVLHELAGQFELVLVDAPPLLAVGDTMALTAHVDATLVVTHFGIHGPLLRELARQLEKSQAPALGFILTGVPHGEGYGAYGYGYGYAYGYEPRAEKRSGSVGRGRERV